MGCSSILKQIFWFFFRGEPSVNDDYPKIEKYSGVKIKLRTCVKVITGSDTTVAYGALSITRDHRAFTIYTLTSFLVALFLLLSTWKEDLAQTMLEQVEWCPGTNDTVNGFQELFEENANRLTLEIAKLQSEIDLVNTTGTVNPYVTAVQLLGPKKSPTGVAFPENFECSVVDDLTVDTGTYPGNSGYPTKSIEVCIDGWGFSVICKSIDVIDGDRVTADIQAQERKQSSLQADLDELGKTDGDHKTTNNEIAMSVISRSKSIGATYDFVMIFLVFLPKTWGGSSLTFKQKFLNTGPMMGKGTYIFFVTLWSFVSISLQGIWTIIETQLPFMKLSLNPCIATSSILEDLSAQCIAHNEKFAKLQATEAAYRNLKQLELKYNICYKKECETETTENTAFCAQLQAAFYDMRWLKENANLTSGDTVSLCTPNDILTYVEEQLPAVDLTILLTGSILTGVVFINVVLGSFVKSLILLAYPNIGCQMIVVNHDRPDPVNLRNEVYAMVRRYNGVRCLIWGSLFAFIIFYSQGLREQDLAIAVSVVPFLAVIVVYLIHLIVSDIINRITNRWNPKFATPDKLGSKRPGHQVKMTNV